MNKFPTLAMAIDLLDELLISQDMAELDTDHADKLRLCAAEIRGAASGLATVATVFMTPR